MPTALPLTELLERPIRNTPKVRVLKSQLGDGYSQRAADGLNARTDNLNLAWNYLSAADAATIIAALDAGFVDYLTYTLPGEGSAKKFVVGEGGYQIETLGVYTSISVSLEQVFDL